MKKILITGGAGYIGSHTAVELINSGFEPIIIDDFSNSQEKVLDRLEEITGKAIACYQGDCADRDLLDQVAKDHHLSGVIHFGFILQLSKQWEKAPNFP